MDKKSLVHIEKKLNVTDLSGEKVMVDFDSGKYFMIKGTGNDIWDLIQSDITVEDIIQKLLGEYDVTEQECEREVIHFLEELLAYQIIIEK